MTYKTWTREEAIAHVRTALERELGQFVNQQNTAGVRRNIAAVMTARLAQLAQELGASAGPPHIEVYMTDDHTVAFRVFEPIDPFLRKGFV